MRPLVATVTCRCTRARRLGSFAGIVLAALLAAAGSTSAQDLPPPSGPVTDLANVLDEATESSLLAAIRGVERETTAEIAVVTVPTLGGSSVEEMAERLFNTWGVGQKGVDNGVLLLVAPNERQVRIEVGYGLEAILPDGLAGQIIRDDILPRFRDGDMPGGITAGVTRLAAIVRARHVLTPEEREALEAAADNRAPRWLMVPFLGAFMVVGGTAIGGGLKKKDIGSLIFGSVFSAVPAIFSLIPFFNAPPWIMLPVLLVAAGLAYRRGYRGTKWFNSAGGGGRRSRGSSRDWSSSSSSWSSSDSSSSSSSDSFGGGSSGGGGASGSW